MAQPSFVLSPPGELHILPAMQKYTDPAYFNHDDILLDERDPMRISTFMSWHIANWIEQGLYGRDLWLSFQREFDGWDTDLFDAASTRPLGILRDFLLYRGVYTPRDRSRVAPNLVAVLEGEDFHPWTSEEVEEIRAKAKDFNDLVEQQSGFLADITRGYVSPAERQRMDGEARAAKAQADREMNEMVARQLAANHAANRSPHNLDTPRSRHTSSQSAISKPSTPQPSPHPSLSYPPIPPLSSMHPPLQATQQPNPFVNRQRGSIFPPPSPIIDHRQPEDYPPWYFETEEKRQSYLSEWRETTFNRIMQKHPDKSKTEVLDDLIEKLALIQRALPVSYHSDEVLRTQLLKACSGIKELAKTTEKSRAIPFSQAPRSSVAQPLTATQSPPTSQTSQSIIS
ncbi:hypothetical protein CSOJ01_15493 [Colletotrichum sojae]|uniref:Uncharacterized protein n=2 Tax=Colletotrichum orchidearum species complex TaxID=2707337 RepID=A0A8H6IME6_9PEZI|nr:hypothetical protein CSOJ01_15493 [Colletotrichum sojae]